MKAIVFSVILISIGFSIFAGEETRHPAEIVARRAVELIIQGDYTSLPVLFDDILVQAGYVTPETMKAAVDSMTTATGGLKEIMNVNMVTRKNTTYVLITALCEKDFTIDIAIGVNQILKIDSFFFKSTQPVFTYKPPKYVSTKRYTEESVLFGTDYQLPATLTVPKTKKSFPVVILVHGSGPNDRDLSIGRNKPFRDIAWGLASQGIGAFRYEKRTRFYSDKGSANTPYAEVVDDVLQAIKFLKARHDVSAVYVLGLSLGGMMMPMIMEHDTDAVGFIMCAAPARTLQELYIEQLTYIYSLSGEMTKAQKRYLEYVTEQAARITKGDFDDTTTAEELLNITPSYWKELNAYDQVDVLKKHTRPVLLLQGEADYQITMQDFALWKTAMTGKNNVTLLSYPRLNHLFIEGGLTSKPADYEKEGHVHEKVIKDIVQWIQMREKERSEQ